MNGRAIVAVVAAAVLGVAGATFTAGAATAATPPIGVSTNGVTFASTIPDALFVGVHLVPGGAVTRSIWVKNQAGSSGNFAIAIRDVSSAQTQLLPQLSIDGRTTSLIGPKVFFDQVDPCSTILKNIPAAAGQTVRIDLTLVLDPAVSGRSSQQAMAAFDLAIALASASVPSPDGCRVTSGGGGVGGTGGGGGTITIHGSTVGGSTASPTPAPDPTETATPTPEPAPTEGGDGIIVPNTGRFFQEYFVGGWLLGAVLGAIIAWVIIRRRHRGDA